MTVWPWRKRVGEKLHDEWVVVAQFNALSEATLTADLAIAKLEGNGIPAVRFPTGAINAPCIGMLGPEPVRILAPPDRADEARELLGEEQDDDR